MHDKFKNILIIKPSALGDIVQVLPALGALRRSFPQAQISWLLRPELAPLLKNNPGLTRIIPFDRKFLGKAWFHPGAFAALLSLFRRLRRSKFDAVFDFQGLFRTAFLAHISGCKNTFGLVNAKELSGFFYTHRIRQRPDSIHVVDHYMDVIRAAGASDLNVEFTLPRDPDADESLARILASDNIASQDYAVLVPGSAHLDKCWPIDRFAALARKLSSEHNLAIIATGTKAETGLVEKLLESADIPITNLADKTSIAQLIALLRGAKLVVSNDTGPGHIAAALGKPVVMIFGRSNPARVEPYGRKNCVAAINPNSRGPLPNSANPMHNIRLITLRDVYDKVCIQLSG